MGSFIILSAGTKSVFFAQQFPEFAEFWGKMSKEEEAH